MQADAFDPMALTVRDLDATCAFYRRALGMEVVEGEGGAKALRFGDRTIALLLEGDPVAEGARRGIPGSADLGFLTPTPLARVIEHLDRVGVAIDEGPVDRDRDGGTVRSIYLLDPDGNRIEVSNRLEAGSVGVTRP